MNEIQLYSDIARFDRLAGIDPYYKDYDQFAEAILRNASQLTLSHFSAIENTVTKKNLGPKGSEAIYRVLHRFTEPFKNLLLSQHHFFITNYLDLSTLLNLKIVSKYLHEHIEPSQILPKIKDIKKFLLLYILCNKWCETKIIKAIFLSESYFTYEKLLFKKNGLYSHTWLVRIDLMKYIPDNVERFSLRAHTSACFSKSTYPFAEMKNIEALRHLKILKLMGSTLLNQNDNLFIQHAKTLLQHSALLEKLKLKCAKLSNDHSFLKILKERLPKDELIVICNIFFYSYPPDSPVDVAAILSSIAAASGSLKRIILKNTMSCSNFPNLSGIPPCSLSLEELILSNFSECPLIDLILLTYIFPSLKTLRIHNVKLTKSALKEEADNYTSTIHKEILQNLRKVSRYKPNFLPLRKGIKVYECRKVHYKEIVWKEVEGIRIRDE